ncbi:MAG TPA: zinc ribbon domain-containing protein, partial [Candidatus Dormibacteraeota bacterium]|nr:zinc ribbon domain-containing protein [Candidatus Dormibacteraeota bacterium]
MVVCSNCGTENAAGFKFCQECGSKLGLTCAGCGAPLRPAAKFCGECGTPNPVVLGAGAAAGGQARPLVDASIGQVSSASGVAPGGRPLTSFPQAEAAGPIAERRVVSILFADLVGFTTLAEGRDPEETRELLSRYFDLARDVVGRYGGVVEKFIG